MAERWLSTTWLTTADAEQTHYTVPAGTSAIVSTLTVCNSGDLYASFRIAVRPGGAALANQHYIYQDANIGPGVTVAISAGLSLGPGDVVTVRGSAASLSFNSFGMEVSSDGSVKVLGQAAPLAATSTTLYTVPANEATTISTLMVCNRGTDPATFRVTLTDPNSMFDARAARVFYDALIQPKVSVAATAGLTLHQQCGVDVYSSTADLTFSAFGKEVAA